MYRSQDPITPLSVPARRFADQVDDGSRHMDTVSQSDLQVCAAALDAVRAQTPRVHCVTNTVVQNFTANVLLAFGAIPSMTINPEEIGDFVGGADALLLNLGTVDTDRKAAIPIALAAARQRDLSVVLDPVFIDRSPGRAEFARGLVSEGGMIVRGNRNEWNALTRDRQETDAAVDLDTRLEGFVTGGAGDDRAAERIAVVTGQEDLIVGSDKTRHVAGGHALMAMVAGVGCAQAAVMGALAARCPSRFHAALAGLLIFALCGERAARACAGPGTFEPEFLDALHRVTSADIAAMAARA